MDIFITVKKILYYIKFPFLRKCDLSVHFIGKRYISIGENTLICQNTCLNVNSRDTIPKIKIGKNCFIGRNNFFTSGESIILGDFVITGPNCSFLGAEHEYSNPLQPYYFSQVTKAKKIEIGLNVFIGANVSLVGNVFIGQGSIIAANVLIQNASIPCFSIVVGNPFVIIKRYSFKDKKWKKLTEWNNYDEESLLSNLNYADYFDNIIIKKKNLPLMSIGKSNGNLYY